MGCVGAAIVCVILVQSTGAAICSSADDDIRRTAYEVLEEYGFPVGLLPKGVRGYELNTTTGKFSVYLDQTCSFSLDQSSYHLKYEARISGYLTMGKVGGLEGIYARLFLVMWKQIVEIVRTGDDLVFSVGVLSSVSPIHHFDQSPQCGCGFHCGNSNNNDNIAPFL